MYPLGACWILNTGVADPARWDLSSKNLFQSPGLRQEAGDRTPASVRTLMPSSWIHSLSSPTGFWLRLSPIGFDPGNFVKALSSHNRNMRSRVNTGPGAQGHTAGFHLKWAFNGSCIILHQALEIRTGSQNKKQNNNKKNKTNRKPKTCDSGLAVVLKIRRKCSRT